jgi:hypothetical protein
MLLRRCLANPASSSQDLRRAALRKVCADAEVQFLDIHRDLVESLEAEIDTVSRRVRESYAYCLLGIARVCTPDIELRIQNVLAASKYVGLRRRSYKLYSPESAESRLTLEDGWRKHRDKEATWLIIKTFPAHFLISERGAIKERITEGWMLSRLYLRISEERPELACELLEVDSISYMYVAAKLRKVPAIDIVNRTIEANLGNERFDLLLWSIGELGLWDLLLAIGGRLPDVARAQTLRILGTHKGRAGD